MSNMLSRLGKQAPGLFLSAMLTFLCDILPLVDYNGYYSRKPVKPSVRVTRVLVLSNFILIFVVSLCLHTAFLYLIIFLLTPISGVD